MRGRSSSAQTGREVVVGQAGLRPDRAPCGVIAHAQHSGHAEPGCPVPQAQPFGLQSERPFDVIEVTKDATQDAVQCRRTARWMTHAHRARARVSQLEGPSRRRPGSRPSYGTRRHHQQWLCAASDLGSLRFPEDPPAIMPGEGSLTATVIRWPGCSSDTPAARPTPRTSPPSAMLAALGVKEARIYVDHGLAGIKRARPGLREALAPCRATPWS